MVQDGNFIVELLFSYMKSIENTTNTVVEKLTLMQNSKEQKTDLQLTALEDQISKLLNVMKNPSRDHPKARPNQT